MMYFIFLVDMEIDHALDLPVLGFPGRMLQKKLVLYLCLGLCVVYILNQGMNLGTWERLNKAYFSLCKTLLSIVSLAYDFMC